VLAHLLMPANGVSAIARSADGQVVGIARLTAAGATLAAELTVMVRDDHQRGGLGKELVRYVAHAGLDSGCVEFTAIGSADNRALVGLLRSLGLRDYARVADGLLTIRAPIGVITEAEELDDRLVEAAA
jgi:GNAT superfamily N-acetyltransferase